MKILILSFYFPPDLSAGSFRIAALLDALNKLRPSGLEVEVITTQPNRYEQTAGSVDAFEDHGWFRIKRITLPRHNSGMTDQALAFAAFSKQAIGLTKKENWDLVFATSSRLMTASLGAFIARKLKAPLYLDIRDLFTDTMDDVLNTSSGRLLLPFFKWVERATFQRAKRISLVSEGFVDHIRKITSPEKISIFTNGIDDIFLETDFRKASNSERESSLPCVLYAGNIGAGQGLHHVLPKVAAALKDRVRFRIVGGGGQISQLSAALDRANLLEFNVEMLPPVPRTALLDEYRRADVLFLHLNDYKAFRKVLPSKIFEYAATGKPIVAGVAGYAADFLRENVPYAAVFDPCDVNGMIAAIEKTLDAPPHIDGINFRNLFARKVIMNDMARDMLKFATQAQTTKQNSIQPKTEYRQ